MAYEAGDVDFLPGMDVPYDHEIARLSRSGERPDFHLCNVLATYFFNFNCVSPMVLGRRNPFVDDRVRKALLDYRWPGNVRELKNVVERAVYTSLGDDRAISSINFDPFASPWRPGADTPQTASEANSLPADPYDFKEYIQNREIELLTSALEQCRFNQKKTAEFLGLTYHQLRGYLRKYELTDTD